MPPLPAPLFAVAGELVPLIMFAVFAISWVLKLISSNKQPNEAPVRRPGRPVRPREGRPAPSWVQKGAANSSLALVIVIGFIAGIAFFISGVLDFS